MKEMYMHIVTVGLLYLATLGADLDAHLQEVNLLTEQVGIHIEFERYPLEVDQCAAAGDIWDVIACYKRDFQKLIRYLSSRGARTMALRSERTDWVMGSASGPQCPIPFHSRPFLTAVLYKGWPGISSTIIAHELLHSFGARHQSDPGNLMHPYAGGLRAEDTWITDATRRQVRRCLTRLKFLGRKER